MDLPKTTYEALREILLGLPFWRHAKDRQAFVETALHEHKLLNSLTFEETSENFAHQLINNCAGHENRTTNGKTPLCALLAAIVTGGFKSWDEVMRLQQELGCADRLPVSQAPAGPAVRPLYHHLPPNAGEAFRGRDEHMSALTREYQNNETKFFIVTGKPGFGKSALVSEWYSRILRDRFFGAERVCAWGFSDSSDEFLADLLHWFKDDDYQNHSSVDKARRLVERLGQYRTLLILDGLDALQAGPGNPGRPLGSLQDPAMLRFLEDVGYSTTIFCVITTRYLIPELSIFRHVTQHVALGPLPDPAAKDFLLHIGIDPQSPDLDRIISICQGNAITLSLIGRSLIESGEYPGLLLDRLFDIAKAFDAGDESDQFKGYHSFITKFAEAYRGTALLAVLKLACLFRKPFAPDTLITIFSSDPIPGFTDILKGQPPKYWQNLLAKLDKAGLLIATAGSNLTYTVHALVSGYFRQNMEKTEWEQPQLYAAYRLLSRDSVSKAECFPSLRRQYEHLYDAMYYGFKAKDFDDTFRDIYWPRIRRKEELYSNRVDGFFSAELMAWSPCFKVPWQELSEKITDIQAAIILNDVGYNLRALGRIADAEVPTAAALERAKTYNQTFAAADRQQVLESGSGSEIPWISGHQWQNDTVKQISVIFTHLSVLHQLRGRLRKAIDAAEEGKRYARFYLDHTEDSFWWIRATTQLALCYTLLGKIEKAGAQFREIFDASLTISKDPTLQGTDAFCYVTFLLQDGNWDTAAEYASSALACKEKREGVADTGLEQIALGLALLDQFTATNTGLDDAQKKLLEGHEKLERLGRVDLALVSKLALARLYRVAGTATIETRRRLLDDIVHTSDRGNMQLYEADGYIEYAFFDAESATQDPVKWLNKADGIVADTGYGSRDVVVADLRRLFSSRPQQTEER